MHGRLWRPLRRRCDNPRHKLFQLFSLVNPQQPLCSMVPSPILNLWHNLLLSLAPSSARTLPTSCSIQCGIELAGSRQA
jgi:hypothetical protein